MNELALIGPVPLGAYAVFYLNRDTSGPLRPPRVRV